MYRAQAQRFVTVPLLVVLAATTAVALPPPSASDIERFRQDGTLQARVEAAMSLGHHQIDPALVRRLSGKLEAARLKSLPWGQQTPDQRSIDSPPPDVHGGPTKGISQMFVLLIEFPESPHDPAYTPASIDEKMFGNGNPADYPYESMRNYYLRSSYNQLLIKGHVFDWYTASHSRSYYESAVTMTERFGREALIRQLIIKECVGALDQRGHDFTQYDADNDGTIDSFFVMWTGGTQGWAELWSMYAPGWWDYDPYTVDGKKLRSHVWAPVGEKLQPMIHEEGHVLGLPDYYQYPNASPRGPKGGVGGMDMMHYYYGDHNSFSKMLLDWVEPTVVASGGRDIVLRPLGTSPDCVLIMPGASAGQPFSEFFMAEYRKRSTGNDTSELPADGMVIWHVDATLKSDGSNFLYDNSTTEHKLLRLMEADGLEEIEQDLLANAGDIYQAPRSLGPYSQPSSRSYPTTTAPAGADTGVFIGSFTTPAETMSARFSIGEPIRILGVTSNAPDHPYTGGSTIELQALFSGPVSVSGAPVLQLATGAISRPAAYVSGSGSAGLTFRYTVQPGDASNDLDYASSSALDLKGGTIKDPVGNNVSTQLPAPGTAGSLSASANIRVVTGSTTDLIARELYFSTEPGGWGDLYQTPAIGQSVYACFLVEVKNGIRESDSAVFASLELDGVSTEFVGAPEDGSWLTPLQSPWIVTAGTHRLRGVANPKSEIAESDRTNNELVLEFTPGDRPVPYTPPVILDSNPNPGTQTPQTPNPGSNPQVTVDCPSVGSCGGGVPTCAAGTLIGLMAMAMNRRLFRS